MKDSDFQHSPRLQVGYQIVVELAVCVDGGFVAAFESQGL
jgi:hypothetical protein